LQVNYSTTQKKQVGNSTSIARLIVPYPTDNEERLNFVTQVGTGLYSAEQALSFVRTDDFDVIIIFYSPAYDIVNASWFSNFLPYR